MLLFTLTSVLFSAVPALSGLMPILAENGVDDTGIRIQSPIDQGVPSWNNMDSSHLSPVKTQ